MINIRDEQDAQQVREKVVEYKNYVNSMNSASKGCGGSFFILAAVGIVLFFMTNSLILSVGAGLVGLIFGTMSLGAANQNHDQYEKNQFYLHYINEAESALREYERNK